MSGRVIVVGDVHGCIEELDELLLVCQFKQGTDRLVLAGDLVDRGPDSHGVVQRAMELRAEAVMGNHEERHIRYHHHELRRKADPTYRNPMRANDVRRDAEHNSLTDADWAYLEKLPHYLRVDKRILVVHAGCMPGIPIEKQEVNHCLRLRYVDRDTGKMAQQRAVEAGPPERYPLWYDVWRGPDNIIFGHMVMDGSHHTATSKDGKARCWGIDTGCCFGGKLTAAVLCTKVFDNDFIDFVSVDAKGVYHAPQKWTE